MLRAEELWSDIQCICEVLPVSHPERRSVKVHQTPLAKDRQSDSTKDISQVLLTLWKLVQNESAYLLMSSNWATWRYSGHESVTPAHAAST